MNFINFYTSVSLPWGKNSRVFSFNDDKWLTLEKLYTNYHSNARSNNFIIPKKIHQIWLGKDIPDDVIFLSNKIKLLNPDWEYILWTDNSFDFLEPSFLFEINKIENVGVKSDILRYLIVEKYGGLYLDCDFIPVRNFEQLIKDINFIAGVCNPDDNSLPLINNGFFASKKNHPILKSIIINIKKNIGKLYSIKSQNDVFQLTGPELFTDTIFFYLKESNDSNVVIYPSTYFYPICCRNKFKISTKYIEKSINTETYAIHLWNASWFKTNKSFYSRMKLLLPYRHFIFLSKIFSKIKNIKKT